MVNVFSLFHYYFSMEKGMALHLKKTWIPFTQGWFVVCLVEFTLWFWIRIFWKLHQCIFAICNYLHLEKDVALHLINLNPLHSRMLCVKFAWNWPSDSGEDENVKSLRQWWQWTTDNRQISVSKAHLSHQLQWAKNT